jgi:hypothetical protein
MSLRFAAGLVFLSACFLRAQQVDVEFDETADFSQFKTFAIVNGQINSKAPALNNELIHKKVENEIRKALTAKGLEETSARPNLNVRWTLGSARGSQVEAYPAGWRGLGTRWVRVPTTEGTLVINLRDTSKRELVWRGIAVEEEKNPSKVKDRLDEMVKKTIAKYPPKKK